MNITYNNYEQEIKNVDWAKIPKNISEVKGDMQEFFELYNDDATIKETFDLFLENVNKHLPKPELKKKFAEAGKKAEKVKKSVAKYKKGDTVYYGKKMSYVIITKVAIPKPNTPFYNKEVAQYDIKYNDSNKKAIGIPESSLYFEAVEVKFKGSLEKNYNYENVEVEIRLVPVPYVKGKYFIWDVKTKQIFANEYFKTLDKAKKFVEDNKMKLVSSPSTAKKTIKAVVNKENVNFYNDEFRLLRRFYNLVTKKGNVSFRSVQLLYMAFEKTAIARKVRKTSTDADLYNNCNTKLVNLYNNIAPDKQDAKINFADQKLLKELESLVKCKQVDTAILLLNRVINMQGTTPDNIKVERLVSIIENAINTKKVTESNRLYSEILTAKTELKSYLKGDVPKVPVKKQGLSRPALKKKVVTKKPVRKTKSKLTSLVPKEPTQKFTVMVGEKPTIKKVEPVAETLKREVSATPLIEHPVLYPKKEPLQLIENTAPVKKIAHKHNLKPISDSKNTVNEYFHISGDIAKLLGKIEKKPTHSVAVTLDASQGSGKTRAIFQMMNEFADKGYQCLFASLEEHPESALFKEKVNQYINPKNQKNIFAIGDLEKGYDSLEELIPSFDVVFIDSWNKVAEMGKVDFDTDLRKKYDGKLFVGIFQRTQDGKMRGGSKAQFDGDVILKIKKFEDFRDNYIYADKNRYQDLPLNEVCYSIYDQQMIPLEALNGAAEEVEPVEDLTGEHVVIV